MHNKNNSKLFWACLAFLFRIDFFFSVCLSPQTAQKVLKAAKQTCQRLGQYRMPFAWAAK